jgi:hypothetical protein
LEVSTRMRAAYRLWLIRRFVRLFWEKLVGNLERAPEVVVQPAKKARRAVMAFQKQEAVSKANFKAPPEPVEELNYPLGDTPLLPTKFTLGEKKGGFMPVTFETVDGIKVALGLNRDQIYSVCHLLVSAVAKSDWDLDLRIDDDSRADVPSEKQLH